MGKDSYYFSHDYHARHDPKMEELQLAYGMEGVGVFWCVVEMLYEQGGKLPLHYVKTIAHSLHVDEKAVQDVISGFGLFTHDDTDFWSESVMSRLDKRNRANESRRQKQLDNHRRYNEAFTPPTLEDVKAYITETKSPVDPEQFWNYYQSVDWMVGKNKCKDWKAKARQWKYNKKDIKKNVRNEIVKRVGGGASNDGLGHTDREGA